MAGDFSKFCENGHAKNWSIFYFAPNWVFEFHKRNIKTIASRLSSDYAASSLRHLWLCATLSAKLPAFIQSKWYWLQDIQKQYQLAWTVRLSTRNHSVMAEPQSFNTSKAQYSSEWPVRGGRINTKTRCPTFETPLYWTLTRFSHSLQVRASMWTSELLSLMSQCAKKYPNYWNDYSYSQTVS